MNSIHKKYLAQLFFATFLICTPFALAHGATLTYPGAAPCDTTLQGCIDGAASGDVIKIATDNLIEEDINIEKSLTLTTAEGFQSKIGSSDPLSIGSIDVNTPAGISNSIEVVLDDISFYNVRLSVNFNKGANHRFTLSNSSILMTSDDYSAIAIDATVPNEVQIIRNFLRSNSGHGVEYVSGFSNPGDARLAIIGNRITSPDEGKAGIYLRTRDESNLTSDIMNNVIYAVAGCDCEGASGIDIQTSGNSASTVNIINNTLDDIQGSSNGIQIESPDAGSQLTANIFNNVVSRASEAGLSLPAFTSQLTVNLGYNFFFNNKLAENFGGYTPGSNTIFNGQKVNPLFVNASEADYHLLPKSPLINHGTNTPGSITLPETDADATPRIVDGTIDIGAYEYKPLTPSPTAAPSSTPTPEGKSPIIRNEICNNNIDDDGDSKVDCQDVDCAFDLHCAKGTASFRGGGREWGSCSLVNAGASTAGLPWMLSLLTAVFGLVGLRKKFRN